MSPPIRSSPLERAPLGVPVAQPTLTPYMLVLGVSDGAIYLLKKVRLLKAMARCTGITIPPSMKEAASINDSVGRITT